MNSLITQWFQPGMCCIFLMGQITENLSYKSILFLLWSSNFHFKKIVHLRSNFISILVEVAWLKKPIFDHYGSANDAIEQLFRPKWLNAVNQCDPISFLHNDKLKIKLIKIILDDFLTINFTIISFRTENFLMVSFTSKIKN